MKGRPSSFLYHFFCYQQKKTKIDSANQTGNYVSIWTTKDYCFVAQRDRLSTLKFFVLGIWMISEFLKLSLGSWYFLSKLQKLTILLVPKPSSSVEDNLLQMKPETDVNSSFSPLPIWEFLFPNEVVLDML